MRLGAGAWAYLNGDAFDNGLRVPFSWEPEDRRLRSRADWLEELCRERAVIHVGCVDHSVERLEAKRRRGKWLHDRLSTVAARCYGVDTDARGIAYLRDQLGFDDVAAMDLLHDDNPDLLTGHWDVMLLGEVLEHVDDPVGFLARLRERYAHCVESLVVTVPNAFAQENHRSARRSAEVINSDHRFWFTPYTLAKVAVRAGLVPERLLLCRNGVVKRRSFLKNAFLAKHPLLRNNLILVAPLDAGEG